jgi:poly(A) polymerase
VDDSLPVTSKPLCRREDALAVLTRLRENGHVAYFAGGCVRDELLGLTPKDYDIATDAPPDRVRQLFSNAQAVGAAFGVILVRHKRSVVEVATFRTDGRYLDGRRPEAVTFTNAEEDAKRRDFTINGMFLDPIENKVIDYVGGQRDLTDGLIRAIGNPDHRFEEDHLRVLRAIRFAAKFEFEIEQVTADAVRVHAPQLKRISPERIADELRRTLTIPEAGGDWAWQAMLNEFPGLAEIIFRFLAPPPNPQDRAEKARVFNGFSRDEPWPFGLCLAAISLDWLLLQAPRPELLALLERRTIEKIARALRQSLRISNEESDQLTGSLEGIQGLLRQPPPGVAQLKRFLARPTADLSRQLLNALSCHVGAQRVQPINERLDEWAKTEFAPAPLITGDDLTDAGLIPGRAFKLALDQTYDAQLEGRITTRKEALEMAIGIAKVAAAS